MLKPLKFPANRWLPRNARSELAKFSPLPRGAAGFAGSRASRRRLLVAGFSARLGPACSVGLGLWLVGLRRCPAGYLGSKNPGGFGRFATSSMFARRDGRVLEAGLQAHARIVRGLWRLPRSGGDCQHDGRNAQTSGTTRLSFLQLLEHRGHTRDFHPLIGVDVRGEGEDLRSCAAPGVAKSSLTITSAPS